MARGTVFGDRYDMPDAVDVPRRGIRLPKKNPAELVAEAKRARIFRQLGELTSPELTEVEAAIKRIKEARVNG